MAPLMDLSDTVRRFSTAYTCTRKAKSGGAYNSSGVYVQGGSTSVTVHGMAAPHAVGVEQDRQSSGVDIDARLDFYSVERVYAGDDAYEPDVLVIDGQAYEVNSVAPWGALGNFWMSVLTRKD